MEKETLELFLSKVAVPTNFNDVAINLIWAIAVVICIVIVCAGGCFCIKRYLKVIDEQHDKERNIKLKEIELKEKDTELNKQRLGYSHEIQKMEVEHKIKMEEWESQLKKDKEERYFKTTTNE